MVGGQLEDWLTANSRTSQTTLCTSEILEASRNFCLCGVCLEIATAFVIEIEM